MTKKQNSVRSLSIYERDIERLGTFRVVQPLPVTQSELERVGFLSEPAAGEFIVPKAIGPHSSFNTNGRQIVRKDLPKISQSRMVWSTWKDWHGNPHSGTQVRTQKVYERELIPPPEEALTVVVGKDGAYLISRPFSRATDADAVIIHVINLFLEIFGGLKIMTVDLQAPSALVTKRLAWRVLPPGEYPFDKAHDALQHFIEQVDESERPVVVERIKSVTQHKPDFIAVGIGGFSDYVVFGFQKRGIYVLESPSLGNATYIFSNNWEELSALTKKEILEGELHQARLIHNRRWRGALRSAIVG